MIVKCPRAGGAFGGKITRGMPLSCAAALCSTKLNRPVRIFNTRTADMAQHSKCFFIFFLLYFTGYVVGTLSFF